MKAETIYASRVFDFLSEIAPILRNTRHAELAGRVEAAMKYYVAPVTSEFYGEAMTVLADTVTSAHDVLTPQQLHRAQDLAAAIKAQWFSRNV